jgi:undecaprenyl-diphosphatase
LAWLTEIDTGLFLFFNVKLANAGSDLLMPIITNDWFLRVVFLIIILYLLILGKKRGRIAAALCIVTVAASDLTSAAVFKPLFERIRPCHVIANVHLLVNCSQGLSFPSSHAANSFGQAALLAAIYPRHRVIFLLIAAVVSYSRIAVGVHYPFDVLAGALLGIGCGLAVFFLHRQTARRFPLLDYDLSR